MDMIVLAVEDDALLSRKERRSTRKAIIVVDPWGIVVALSWYRFVGGTW